jgi:hypothetical protein
MPELRKRLLVAVFALGALIAFVLALVLRPSTSPPPGTLAVHYITTNAAGRPMALLELKLHKAAWARFDSIEMRQRSEWQRMRAVPTNVLKQVDWLCGIAGASRRAHWIDFPTHGPWKLGLEVVEPRSGIGGAMDRVFHARSYYQAGGWSNIVRGTRLVPYVGRSWRVETEEIGMPLAK